MNTSDNCQNCAAKDKVTIAGKSFCANCGTPQNNSTSQKTTPVNQPQSSTSNLTAQNDPTQQNSHAELVESLTQSLSGSANILAPNTDQPNLNSGNVKEINNVQPAEKPSIEQSSFPNQPVITNSAPPSPQIPITSQTQVDSSVHLPQQPSIASQPSNIKKFSAVQKPISTSSTNDIKGPVYTAQTGVLDLQSSQQKPNSPQIAVDAINPTSPPATGGTELGSFSNKDEHVFSDDQFKALEQTGNDRPIDVAALSQKPVPQQPNTLSDIRPAMPTQPGQIITPQNVQTSAESALPSSLPQVSASTITPHITHISQSDQSAHAVSNTARTQNIQPSIATSPAVTAMLEPSDEVKSKSPKNSLTKKGTKIGTVALTAVGLLLLGAYVWQVNYPNLALKVASSKAGIKASIPSYLPSGWQVSGNINSTPGSISYQLSSADGKASATISEKKTDWDSQALAENYVNNQSDKYLALQAEGLTIYVYGNQASWVNNGTWYRIEGNNTGLSQDQLIRMATSL
jgi:hypothetical protein